MPTLLRWWLTALLNGFSQIFLLVDPRCGALVLLALLSSGPDLLIGALLGNLIGALSAWRLGGSRRDIAEGLYGYNGALLGALLGLSLGAVPLAWLLTVLGARAATVLQLHWLQRVRKQGWLAGYTLGFVLLGWGTLALLGGLELLGPVRDTALETGNTPLAWGAAVLRGLAQVMFLDSATAGACLALALWLADPRTACWALLGSAAGLGLVAWSGAADSFALAGLGGYNTALLAIVLGRWPAARWMLLPGLPLALALQQSLTLAGLAPLTGPFIACAWLAAQGLRLGLPRRLRLG